MIITHPWCHAWPGFITGEVRKRSRLPLLLPPSLSPCSQPPKGHRSMHILAQPHISLPCARSCQVPDGAFPTQRHTCSPCQGPFPKPAFPWHLGKRFLQHPSIQQWLPTWGSWGRRQGCRATLRAGWPTGLLLQLSRLQGDPLEVPCLHSPTAFLDFLCFSPPSTRKGQALHTCLLAGHGMDFWESPEGDQLCCEGRHKLAASGWAIRGSSRLPVPNLPVWHWKRSLHGLLPSPLLLCLLSAVGQRERCLPTPQAAFGVGVAHNESRQWLRGVCGQLSHPPPEEWGQGPEQIPAETLQSTQAAYRLWPRSWEQAACGDWPRAEAHCSSEVIKCHLPPGSCTQCFSGVSPAKVRGVPSQPCCCTPCHHQHSGAVTPAYGHLSHPINIPVLCRGSVFQNQRTTHCTECFPTLSQQHGKSKEETSLECMRISLNVSSETEDVSLTLLASHVQAPEQECPSLLTSFQTEGPEDLCIVQLPWKEPLQVPGDLMDRCAESALCPLGKGGQWYAELY